MNSCTPNRIYSAPTRIIVLGLAACTAFITASSASADSKAVKGEVLVVLGKQSDGPSDAALKDIAELKHPPFNAYRSMSLVSRNGFKVALGKESKVELPNGRTLSVKLEKVMPDQRMLVKVSITKPGESDYLPLLQVAAQPGKRFFVAGQRYKDGTLFVGLSLNP